LRAVIVGAARNLTNTVPVANDHAFKAHLASKQIGENCFAAVNFVAIPAIKG
jgi:hypothetical protein